LGLIPFVAHQGARFANSFVQILSATPSRATLLTGHHRRIASSLVGNRMNSRKPENTMIPWLCHVGGWVLACVGFSLIVGPLKAVANIIPIFGRIVGTVTFFAAVSWGTIVCLITIAVA
jgi:hypothetical protein